MQKFDLTIESPLAGLVKATAFQTQPPYTTLETENFWPVDIADGRKVSAVRPPLVPITSPGTPVNMLARVSGNVTGQPIQSVVAAVAGDIYWWTGSAWTAVSSSETVTTTRAVYATAWPEKLYIANDSTPLVYDYDAQTLAEWTASDGTVPSDCRCIATWQGCIVLAGQLTGDPHAVFMSRTGDPDDWQYGGTGLDDVGAPVAFIDDNQGVIAEPISALVPFTSDLLVIAGPRSVYGLYGHPLRGGVLENISSSLGILGQGAWAVSPQSELFFMSHAGLAVLLPRPGAVPSLVSDEKIPDELRGLSFDFDDPRISMAYDSRWNGIIITVRGSTILNSQAWWYDLKHGGFHKMKFSAYPYVLGTFEEFGDEHKSPVLWGGAGFEGLGQFDREGLEDMPTPKLSIGPIRMSNNARVASHLAEAKFIFGNNTNDENGTVSLYTGQTGEDVAAKVRFGHGSTRYQTTVGAIMANDGMCYPKITGGALMIKLEGGGGHLSFEAADLGFVRH